MTAQTQFRKMFSIMTRYLRSVGFRYKVTSGTRSRKKQAQLYSAGGPYPVAPPGTSQHEYGLARDMVVSWQGQRSIDAQRYAGSLWLQLGGYWSENDPVHFAAYDPGTWSQILGAAEQIPVGQFAGGSGLGLLPYQPPQAITATPTFSFIATAGRTGISAPTILGPSISQSVASARVAATQPAPASPTVVVRAGGPVSSVSISPGSRP